MVLFNIAKLIIYCENYNKYTFFFVENYEFEIKRQVLTIKCNLKLKNPN